MSEVNIKKVKPYPINIQVTGKGAPIQGQIIKLVMKGFIADLQGSLLKVGDLLEVTFELPVIRRVIHQHVKVIKTYDRTNGKTRKVDRLAEFHFRSLSDSDESKIQQFLQMIGQKEI